jgi:hypothetical protein
LVIYNGERERAIENEKKLHEWFKSLPKDSQIRKTAKIMINMRYGILAYEREDKKE